MSSIQEKVISAFDKFIPDCICESIYANKFLHCYLEAKRECKLTQEEAYGILDELEEAFDKISIKTSYYFTVKAMFISAKDKFLNSFKMEERR